MAGSQAAKSAISLAQAAPEERVNEAGEHFVEGWDLAEGIKTESRPASVFIATKLSHKPFARSDRAPMTLALLCGYGLRMAAKRRGDATLSDEELGVDQMPRGADGEIEWEVVGGGDERGHAALDAAWSKVFELARRDDISGFDPPMWKFIVSAVTVGCDRAGKIHRAVTFDDMVSLVSTGYVIGMFDEVAGWDPTNPPLEPVR